MQNPFQISFFRILKQLLPPSSVLIEEVAEILQVSQDSVYRRLRGETAMSIDEALAICNHYKLPISMFVDSVKGLATFRYVSADNSPATFKKYLSLQKQHLEQLTAHDDAKICYAAIDAPLFHHYGYEALCTFKFHFWQNVVLGIDELKGTYRKSSIDPELITIAKNLHAYYMQVPSDEIWSDNILDTTVKQIEFYWDSGYFAHTDDAIEILQALQNLLDEAEKMAEHGTKLLGHKDTAHYGAYQLYQSDILLGNNTVLTYGDNKKTTYISHQTFNMLICTEESYCNETEAWIKKIVSKSNLISGTSEKMRTKFFRKLQKRIDETKEIILTKK
jgi:hypothetical protein